MGDRFLDHLSQDVEIDFSEIVGCYVHSNLEVQFADLIISGC